MNDDFTLDKLDKSIRRLIQRGSEFNKTNEFISIPEKIPTNLHKIINSPEFIQSKEKFNNWFLQIIKENKIPYEINGLYFGLFETTFKKIFKRKQTIAIHLIGSFSWDQNDSDWACDEDFVPEKKFIYLEIMEEIYNNENINIYTKCFLALAIMFLYLKEFFETQNNIKFITNNSLYIATGFDDGDLYNLFKVETQNNL
ncbi:hypothetical protein EHQ31_18760 [Leptospira montravelensis]|uniref:Uncharacterized protein n=1 Tax=Leptospira montravelensis TaxID=2484961 RepID=A0ABY2LL18_9LEPT|nr:hypothetical protein [Leptospira montravelensis]TGK82701.1 hypothetical protein EHQ19_08460 [Leptospira montravelensis]TGK95006.1 hypothetical protein EHQ31_18760 [Leptospira montravelensis]